MRNLLLTVAILLQLGAVAQENLVQRLDSLTAAYEASGFHGVVLVAKGPKVLYEKAYGLANFDKKIKHTQQTLFKTESVGKMFTAVSILQLVEQKKLRLNQTLKELLPHINIKNSDSITVHHLLNHTSGIKSPWDHPQWSFKKEYSKAELQQVIEELPLAFDKPGKEMFYSNAGYILLSWIIEKVTGMPYDRYFQKNIFDKLQMTATGHLNDTLMPEKNGAQPYKILSSKKYVSMNSHIGPKASGAGGWISTPRDLHRFMSALYGNQLLKAETFAMMRSANGNTPGHERYRFYGYGIEQYHNTWIPGGDMFGHNGGGAGFSVDAFMDPATGYIVTSCTNLYQNSRAIAANYLNAALQKPLQPVQPLPWVKVYDKVEVVGIDTFLADGITNLKELGLDVNPGLLAMIADILQEAGYNEAWAKWTAWAVTQFPDQIRLLILSAESHTKIGNKEAARKYYEAARAEGTKKNETWIVNLVDERLKTL
ncbi:MAG: serine hydrolase domain-containing protein [Chitinophagaceae bacterium]